jgi:hypothetical protein
MIKKKIVNSQCVFSPQKICKYLAENPENIFYNKFGKTVGT